MIKRILNFIIETLIIYVIAVLFCKIYAMPYQEVHDGFKLLNIKSNLEIYTNGEEKLYKLHSPHGHWFNPQGWGHSEQISLDLRRFKVNMFVIDYIPLYFAVNYRTWAYIPYADSLQLVGQEIGAIIPIFAKNLNLRMAVMPESWSGSQVTSLEYNIIGHFITNAKDYYLLNFNLGWHENSFLSLIRYIENDNLSWTSSKAINFDFNIDTRALGNFVYFGYRLNYKWNDDPTQLPLEYKYAKHTLYLGNCSEIIKDINLIYEGSFEWRDNIRVGRINLILSYQTNLD